MKRVLVLVLLAGAAAAGAALVQNLDRDRQYHRFLATGEQALRNGNSYIAIEAFSGAVALRPDSMVAFYRRGEAYRAQRRDAEAIRDLNEARRLAPDASQPLVALGQVYDARGEAAQAAEWYRQAADRLKDEDPAVLYALALARYRAGSPAAAIEPLRRITARSDAAGSAHYLLGLVYRDTNNIDGAVRELETAIKIEPGLVAALEELSDMYRAEGRTADEMAQLQKLAALDPKSSRRVDIALSQARRGQFDDALATLAEAAADTPEDSRVQLARGRVFLTHAERTAPFERSSANRAQEVLEKALGGTARRSEGLALLGRALDLSGDYTEAERILREAVTTSPVDPEAFAFLADAAEHLSHYSDARDALVSLASLQGDLASAETRAVRARRVGVLSLKASDGKSAVEFLAQAIDGGHNDPATLGLMAQALWQTGALAEARTTLGKALAREPANSELQRLAKLMK